MSISDWAVTGTATLTVLQWALIPHLLAQRCKPPGSTLAWLWALLLFPGIGAIFYILIGNERVPRKRVALMRALDQGELGQVINGGLPAPRRDDPTAGEREGTG